MSESAIADFVADFTLPSANKTEPTRGRIVMSSKRLVLATGNERKSIPLPKIFDIRVGHVPPNIEEFFEDTVTIAYRQNENKYTVVIEAEADKIDRFAPILFRAILNGSTVMIRHPVRIGGRVTGTGERRAEIKLADGEVAFMGLDESVRIDLSTVIYYEGSDPSADGGDRPVLTVRHMRDGTSVTTELSMRSHRKMNLLGRYLRLEYSEAMADIEDLSIPESEMKVLIGLYSGGSEADLASLTGRDEQTVSRLLDSLESKELVINGDGETALTSKGRMVVVQRMEAINS